MPIYVFKCDTCGKESELVVGMGTIWTTCPHCGETAYKEFTASALFNSTGLPNGFARPA